MILDHVVSRALFLYTVAYTSVQSPPQLKINKLRYFLLLCLQVYLQPQALFERFEGNSKLVIMACDRPSIPPLVITPAIPAPAEYTHTVFEFLRHGRLKSPDVRNPALPTSDVQADKVSTPPFSTATSRRRRHLARSKDIEAQGKAYARARVRRGAAMPGTRSYRRPNDPDPDEPFAITVENGAIFLELVAHAHGGSKSAYRLAVHRMGTSNWREQGASRAPAGAEEGEVHSREVHPVHEAKLIKFKGGVQIPVVAAEKENLDGVHAAPVFLGGQLLGFALQVLYPIAGGTGGGGGVKL